MDISIQTIILTLLAFYIIYIITKKNNNNIIYTVSCNEEDISCKMYNHRDITSKCTAMCHIKFPDSDFNDNHTFKDNIHACECVPKTDKTDNVEKFVPMKDFDTPILGEHVGTDVLFSDRNYTEKQNHDRFSSLIFG
jgi:hypothetical protein